MKTITISITATDIARGKPQIGTNCPIAHSIKRTLSAKRVIVGSGSGYAYMHNGWRRQFVLPNRTFAFRHAFDTLQKVKPGLYEIDLAPYASR